MKVIPQELRLGNLILHELFGAVEVIAIYKNSYDVTRDGKTKEWFAGLGCKGIPLTEEWLLKAGAEAYEFDHKPSQYIIGDRLIVIRDGCFYEYGTNLKLEFVHRFQNLFFELQNGKELEFKL